MKRLTAIFMLVAFLSGNTAFGQLLKLPALLRHFQLHSQQARVNGAAISFFEFVREHYDGTADVQKHLHLHSSTDSHETLPFKSINCQAMNHVLAAPQHSPKVDSPPVSTIRLQTLASHQQFCSSAFDGNIWQPPRLG